MGGTTRARQRQPCDRSVPRRRAVRDRGLDRGRRCHLPRPAPTGRCRRRIGSLDRRSHAGTASGTTTVTGYLIRFRIMARTRTSSDAELLVELRRDDDVPLHRQLEQELRGGDPLRPPRLGQCRAVDARPRDPARPLAGRRRRGVRAARRRGLPDEPARRHDPHRRGRRGRRPPTDAPHPARGRRTSAIDFGYGRPDVIAIPARRLAAVDAAGPDRGAERAARLPRPARRRRAPRGTRRLPQPRARHVRRCAAGRRQQRLRAGASCWSCPRFARAARRRIAVEDPSLHDDFRRVADLLGMTIVAGSRGRRRDPGRCARPHRCRPRPRDACPPVPHGRRPVRGAPSRARPLGDRRLATDHRGRLRRRVPLRPRADRGDPGPRARARRLRRLCQQDARARHAPRLARRPGRSRRRPCLVQAVARPRFAESRPAGLRRLPRARRVRPPSAADAADLSGPPRRALESDRKALARVRSVRRIGRPARGRLAAAGPPGGAADRSSGGRRCGHQRAGAATTPNRPRATGAPVRLRPG